MINTENNESVLDVVKKKKFIKNIYSKIVNLENEVEFGESLTSATLKNVKRGYDYQRYEKLTNEKLNLNPSFSKKFTNISASKSKISFFEDVTIKALEMTNDSRDLFWSMMYTIIKLSSTMNNKDEFEAIQLYRNWEGYKAELGGFGKFSVKWISDQIKFLYSESEIREVLTVFDLDYNNTIDYLVENIVKRTDTELPFQDPCLVNLLSGLLDSIRVFVNWENIELKGEVFKNLSKILFSIFSADKLEKQLHQYAKFLVLQTISSSEKGYRDVFVDCLKQIEEFDYPLLEICKKTFSQEMEKRNTLAADIYLNMAEMDDWNTYSIKDLEMFFEKRVIQKSFASLRSYLPYTFNYKRAPFLYLKVRELHDYLLSDTDQLTDDDIYKIKNFFIYIFFCYFDKERKDVTFSDILSGYFRENELKTPGIPESPFNVYIFHKKIRKDLYDFMKIALEYLIERSEYGKVQFNLSDYSHKNINVEHKNGCKTFHTIKSFYEDFIGFIKKLQRDNPDLLEKIDFTYDSKRNFSKVLNFQNYSNFNFELSDDEYFYYRISKILCKTFDVFSEIMKDNNKTELELLQREVVLYRDQVVFYKKIKDNK